jgi:hypothetical protein
MQIKLKFLSPLLVIMLGTHVSVASEKQTYVVHEGDDGKEAYLTIGDGLKFVIAGCKMDGTTYSSTLSAIPSEGASETPPLAAFRALGDPINLRVCLDRFCQTAEFSYSGYFDSPAAMVDLPIARVTASRSLSVVLPDGTSLAWSGKLKELFAAACAKPHK